MASFSRSVDNAQVLSISLLPAEKQALSVLQRKLGFSNRSKLVRAGMDALNQEYAALEGLKGNAQAVFVVSHGRLHEHDFDHVLHEYDDVVRTSLHQQSHETCVQVLMADGPAERLRTLFSALKTAKGVRQVSVFLL